MQIRSGAVSNVQGINAKYLQNIKATSDASTAEALAWADLLIATCIPEWVTTA